MPISVRWLVDRKVILLQSWDAFQMTELVKGLAVVQELLDASEPFVHIILDAREMTKLPPNLQEFIRVGALFGVPNVGWVILLSDNRLTRFIAEVVMQTHNTRFRAFNSDTDALNFLKGMEEALKDLDLSALPPIDEAFAIEV